jgi:hypothetical protein
MFRYLEYIYMYLLDRTCDHIIEDDGMCTNAFSIPELGENIT